jgi:hypothetical protein
MLVAMAVGAAAGCSLLVDTSGFSGGATADGADDAEADGAGADAGAGTPPGDAAADAPMEAAPGVCDATFCDDFDQGPLGGKWDALNVSSEATPALTSNAVSPPAAFEVDLPARTSGGTERFAYLAKTLPTTARTLDCRFRLNVVVPPPGNGDVGLFAIEPLPASDNHFLEMKVVADGDLVVYENHKEDGGSIEATDNFGMPAAGQWVLVRVSADFGANTLTLSIDGAAQSFSLRDTPGATSFRLSLGETGDGDTQHFTYRIDDFACTVP